MIEVTIFLIKNISFFFKFIHISFEINILFMHLISNKKEERKKHIK